MLQQLPLFLETEFFEEGERLNQLLYRLFFLVVHLKEAISIVISVVKDMSCFKQEKSLVDKTVSFRKLGGMSLGSCNEEKYL